MKRLSILSAVAVLSMTFSGCCGRHHSMYRRGGCNACASPAPCSPCGEANVWGANPGYQNGYLGPPNVETVPGPVLN